MGLKNYLLGTGTIYSGFLHRHHGDRLQHTHTAALDIIIVRYGGRVGSPQILLRSGFHLFRPALTFDPLAVRYLSRVVASQ